MTTTVKSFTASIIESYTADNTDFAKEVIQKVVDFFSTRKNRSKEDDVNNWTGQQKCFTEIRKSIFSKLPKVETGVEVIDKPETRWDQTKLLTAKNLSNLTEEERQKVIEKVEGNMYELKKVKGISDKFNELLDKRVQAKNESGITEFSIVRSMEAAHKIIQNGIGKASSYYDMFAALLYITGRRQEELFQKMEFSLVDDKPYQLEVKGFAKAKPDKADETAQIPVLFNAKIVLQRIQELRAQNAEGTVNNINKSINRAAESHFPEAATAHKLRALYAETVDTLFNNAIMSSAEIKSAEFKKKALHHASRETTIDHYEYKSTDLQSDSDVREYLKKTFAIMNSRLVNSVAYSFTPLKDVEFEPLMTKSNTVSKTGLQYIENLKEMMQQPIAINFENYKKTYGGVEATFKDLVDLNEHLIAEHNELVKEATARK